MCSGSRQRSGGTGSSQASLGPRLPLLGQCSREAGADAMLSKVEPLVEFAESARARLSRMQQARMSSWSICRETASCRGELFVHGGEL